MVQENDAGGSLGLVPAAHSGSREIAMDGEGASGHDDDPFTNNVILQLEDTVDAFKQAEDPFAAAPFPSNTRDESQVENKTTFTEAPADLFAAAPFSVNVDFERPSEDPSDTFKDAENVFAEADPFAAAPFSSSVDFERQSEDPFDALKEAEDVFATAPFSSKDGDETQVENETAVFTEAAQDPIAAAPFPSNVDCEHQARTEQEASEDLLAAAPVSSDEDVENEVKKEAAVIVSGEDPFAGAPADAEGHVVEEASLEEPVSMLSGHELHEPLSSGAIPEEKGVDVVNKLRRRHPVQKMRRR